MRFMPKGWLMPFCARLDSSNTVKPDSWSSDSRWLGSGYGIETRDWQSCANKAAVARPSARPIVYGESVCRSFGFDER